MMFQCLCKMALLGCLICTSSDWKMIKAINVKLTWKGFYLFLQNVFPWGEWAYNRISQLQYLWHLGLDNCYGGCPVCCRVFTAIPGLFPGDDNSTTPLRRNSEDTNRCCQMSPGGKISHSWEPLVQNTKIFLYLHQELVIWMFSVLKKKNKKHISFEDMLCSRYFQSASQVLTHLIPPSYKVDTYNVYKL